MVNTDPDGPKFHIQKFDPGENRPQPRTFFQCPSFLITRTYSLTATHARSHAYNIRLRNHVFSDSPGVDLRHWHIEERDTLALDDEGNALSKPWRRGYWPGEPSWQGTGPQPGEVNEVVRRHLEQKNVLPPNVIPPHRGLDDLLTAAASRLQTAAAKKKRQAKALRASSSSASSSTSSSSSDTSA